MVELDMKTNVLQITKKHYQVKTDSDKEYCDVKCTNYAWTCSCPDYQAKTKRCKHIDIVTIGSGMRKLSRPTTVRNHNVVVSDECVYCHSKNVRKHSIRYNKSGDVQRYICRDCNRKYSLGRTVSSYEIIVEIMDLHLTGKTSAEIAESLATQYQDVLITTELVSEWIGKYKTILQAYYNTLTRARISRWNSSLMAFESDEIYNKAKRDIAFLYAIVDHETKVWIAQEIWTKRGEYTKNLSPHKAKCLREFYNNQCTILHV